MESLSQSDLEILQISLLVAEKLSILEPGMFSKGLPGVNTDS